MSHINTSAIKYLESKESFIIPTEFEKLAARVKADINNHMFWDLLKFPTQKKTQVRSNSFDQVNGLSKVNVINSHRDSGMTAREACNLVGLSHSTYREWSDRLRVQYVKKY
jgi:hypothetical protein